MLPSLVLLGIPSINSLTPLILPSPLKPRKENFLSGALIELGDLHTGHAME
jgi:hypothetical protein